jgi:hypothetical protein
MRSIQHEWQFFAIAVDSTPRVVVACTKCGLTRSAIVPTGANLDRHVDLTGQCPGEPQPQDPDPVARP